MPTAHCTDLVVSRDDLSIAGPTRHNRKRGIKRLCGMPHNCKRVRPPAAADLPAARFATLRTGRGALVGRGARLMVGCPAPAPLTKGGRCHAIGVRESRSVTISTPT
jgi:hypothetical protein